MHLLQYLLIFLLTINKNPAVHCLC